LCRVISELFDPDDFERHNDKVAKSENHADVQLALATFNRLVQRAGLIAYLDSSGRCYLRSSGTGISSASFSQQTRPLSQDEIVQRVQQPRQRAIALPLLKPSMAGLIRRITVG
jgi:hypothetical protein